MPSLLNLLPNAVGQGEHPLLYAQVVAPAPTTFTEPLNVVMPDWSVEFAFAIPQWPALNGSTLPVVGDEVLLATDNRGTRRVVWWGGIPVAQPTASGTTTGFAAGSGSAVVSGSTFTGNSGSTAYTIGDIVRCLKVIGLIAS